MRLVKLPTGNKGFAHDVYINPEYVESVESDGSVTIMRLATSVRYINMEIDAVLAKLRLP